MPKSRFSEQPEPKKVRKTYKRGGQVSVMESEIIKMAEANQPGGLSEKQVNALAVVLKRDKVTVKERLDEARLTLADMAEDYVALHRKVVDMAVSRGNIKEAAKAIQWGLENMSLEGSRVVDTPKQQVAAPSSSRITIGVKIGGSLMGPQTIDVPAPSVEAEILEDQ